MLATVTCWCTTCRPITLADMRFVVCPECGNKRCPRAHNHDLACTSSNEPGQPGSSWAHVPPARSHARRIQIRRTAGWRMPANAVKVDRSTPWGNPVRVEGDVTAEQAVALFQAIVDTEGGYLVTVRNKVLRITKDDIRRELAGKDLACWCRPGASCHADVLVQIANDRIL